MTIKYHVMVKESPMTIVGVPYEKGVYYDTKAEAEAAMTRARDEIKATWANKDAPVWVDAVDYDRVKKHD